MSEKQIFFSNCRIPTLVHLIRPVVLCFALLLFSFKATAQGDDCAQAIALTNVSNFCSSAAQYTNSGATPSGYAAPPCWTGSPLEDVWFSFVCTGTDVLIAVNGSGMMRPRIAVYTGTCGGILNSAGSGNSCANGTAGSPNTQLYIGGLLQGTTYWIRISSTQANEGAFQLCINNYTPPPSASADCSGAGRLCNKNPLSVVGLSGGGANNNEVLGTCMGDGVFMFETNSVWYTWTCQTAGTLTFDLLPANLNDDIDFAVFQLSTSDPCGPRTVIRCTAASCLNAVGGTGLNMSSIDVNEAPGCFAPSDAYVQFINMTAGTSYALLINNASAANGFTLNWGGSGTFVGPDANITGGPFTVCAGSPVTLNGSTSVNYNSLNWNFVNGSGTPGTATGPGPVNVTYANPGTYTAILNALSATGCTSTETAQIIVNPIVTPTFTPLANVCQNTTAPTLPTTSNNGITGSWSPAVSTATVGTTTYTFTPNAGQCANTTTLNLTVVQGTTVTFNPVAAFCEGTPAPSFPSQTSTSVVTGTWLPATISNTSSGNYTFTPDAGQCAGPSTITITVNPVPTVTPSSNSPICAGDALNLSGNTIAGATYNWDGPNAFDSNQEDPSIAVAAQNNSGNYTLNITNANGCSNSATIAVVVNTEIPPVLTPAGPFCAELTTPITLTSNSAGATWSGNGITNPNGEFTPSVAGVGTQTITCTSTQGCGGEATMDIVVNAAPSSTFNADVLSGCEPLTVNFTSTPGMTSSVWNLGTGGTQNGIGGLQHVFPAGIYSISLTNELGGCSSTTTITDYINVYPNPQASFIPNHTQLDISNTQVLFMNQSVNGSVYSWDFGDGTPGSSLEDPTHSFPSLPGEYSVTLTVTSQNGCVDQTTWTIVVAEDQIIYVPNTFTPDGDEHNNFFLPMISGGFDLLNYHLTVMNRWGEVLFESKDVNGGWDGTYHDKLVQSGTYIWTIRIKDKYNDKYYMFDGHITIIR